tara:strand:+ start:4326 stop:4526 length:201 start_codon:yes stop_codon:yes gene_type:complete
MSSESKTEREKCSQQEASEKLEKVELILKQVKLCLKESVPIWTLELLDFIETDEIGELLKSMGVEE